MSWTPSEYQTFWWKVWAVSVLPVLILLGGILIVLWRRL